MVKKNIIEKWNKKKGLIENISYDNPISIKKQNLNEGLIRTYPIETSIKYVTKLYDLDESQIEVINDNGVDKIRIIVPNKEIFTKKIKKTLDLCGYFCSVHKDYPYIDNWCYMNFEPKKQDDVNQYVRNMSQIYHVTEEKNCEKISKIGLTPKFKNPLFTYPERIYLFSEETPPDEIYNLKNQFKALKKNGGKYCLIILEVSKIPNDVNFYLDPNYGYGIYTKDNIPPTAITQIFEMID